MTRTEPEWVTLASHPYSDKPLPNPADLIRPAPGSPPPGEPPKTE